MDVVTTLRSILTDYSENWIYSSQKPQERAVFRPSISYLVRLVGSNLCRVAIGSTPEMKNAGMVPGKWMKNRGIGAVTGSSLVIKNRPGPS
jgi:hypothetical protein